MAVTGAIAAVGSAATGIIGGFMNRGAASKAAEAQERQLQQGLAFQKEIYGDTKENMQPWIGTGQQAVDALGAFAGLPGHGGANGSGALASYKQFEQTPFYTFPLSQTMETMNRQAAAKGTSLSDGQLASLGKTAGNYSSQNFSTYLSALQNLSGLGASTAGNLGQIGYQTGNQVGNTYGQIGTSQSSGIMGTANENAALMNSFNNMFKTIGGAAASPAFNSGNQTGSSYGQQGDWSSRTFGSGGGFGSVIGGGPNYDPGPYFTTPSPTWGAPGLPGRPTY